MRILDAAIQIGVPDLTLTAPPSSPAVGERHVVASGATGVWAGKGDAIATWQDGLGVPHAEDGMLHLVGSGHKPGCVRRCGLAERGRLGGTR